jgi:hypothetical protein
MLLNNDLWRQTMIRFSQGEILECEFNGIVRRAEVIGLFNDGWSAKMRFLDDCDTFEINAAQLGRWRRPQDEFGSRRVG